MTMFRHSSFLYFSPGRVYGASNDKCNEAHGPRFLEKHIVDVDIPDNGSHSSSCRHAQNVLVAF